MINVYLNGKDIANIVTSLTSFRKTVFPFIFLIVFILQKLKK